MQKDEFLESIENTPNTDSTYIHHQYDYISYTITLSTFHDVTFQQILLRAFLHPTDISFASLWDSTKGEIVGMLTVTDLIAILLYYHDKTSVIKDLIAKESVRKWREIGGRLRRQQLVNVGPEDSLWNSVVLLKQHKIHRLPVITKGGALLHIITHSHLLAYMCSFLSFETTEFFNHSLDTLSIGTYSNVITAKSTDTVYHVIELFSQHGVSAVPIVDEDGSVVDVYSRYDVVYLVREGDYALNCTIEDALKTRPKSTVFTCTRYETLGRVVRHLSKSRIHRLVIVDEQNHVEGVVSISDIFSFFMENAEV